MNNEEKESKYLQYLPSIYQTEKDENGSTFLGSFLKAFEKVLSGIDDGVTIDGVSPDEFIVKTENGNLNIYNKPLKGIEEILDTIHDYFDPMETPLEFLNWLAGWVALTLIEGEGWNEEKKPQSYCQNRSTL